MAKREWIDGEVVALLGGPFDGADAEVIFSKNTEKPTLICERFCKINDGPSASFYVYSLDYDMHAYVFSRIEPAVKPNKT